MKKLASAAAILAAAIPVGSAAAGSPGLSPHVYQVKIAGGNPAVLNGTWRLAIDKPGFSLTKNGAAAVVGTVQLTGNRVTFRDGAGPLACRGSQRSGTYTWRVTGRRLTLGRVHDTCVGRRIVLAHALMRLA